MSIDSYIGGFVKYLILIWALIGLSACTTIRNATNRNMSNPPSETPVTDRTFGEDMLNHFVICRDEKNSDQYCDQKFIEMYSLRLIYEYPNADVERIALWCKSEPLICGFDTVDKAKQLESKFAQYESAHNSNSSNQNAGNIVGAFLKGLGEGMSNVNRNTVNCTANQYGQTVYASCR
jgi:hypothetical protein